MANLMDIKGYWNMSNNYDFNERDMWEGTLLLQDDGWFEGIVVDPSSSYTGERFIFGVYHPEKVIELFKLAPISVSSPFVFHGIRDVKGYDGQFETINFFDTTPCGNSHIITQYPEVDRGYVDAEIIRLELRIQKYKASVIAECELLRMFYNIAIAIRENMTQSVLRNYKEQAFTSKQKTKKLANSQIGLFGIKY